MLQYCLAKLPGQCVKPFFISGDRQADDHAVFEHLIQFSRCPAADVAAVLQDEFLDFPFRGQFVSGYLVAVFLHMLYNKLQAAKDV